MSHNSRLKSPDRFLIFIVAGILLLVAAAFVITLNRQPPSYQDDSLPQGAAHNYLLASSPARKLLLPTPVSGWEWAGLDRWSQEALARQAAHAVEQIIKDQPVSAVRPLRISTIILLGLLFGFSILMEVIGSVLSGVL